MEILNSLKSVVNEKINSPLAGTFIVSWSIWNWKPLYATFFIQQSKLEITKLEYVIPLFNDPWNLIYSPIISTIIIIFFLPLISSVVKLWIAIVRKIYLENDLKLKKITPVPREDLISFYDELDKAEKLHNEEKSNLRKKIKTLETSIETLKTSNTITEEKIIKKIVNKKFTKLDFNLFNSIYKKTDSYDQEQWNENLFIQDENQVIEKLTMNPIFDYYKEQNLISLLSTGFYKLTEKGILFNKFLEKEKFK